MGRWDITDTNSMKKMLFALLLFLGITLSVNAQTGYCKVSNDTGASIYIEVIDWDSDGTVELSIGSDCDYTVNVSCTIQYSYKCNPMNSYSNDVSSTATSQVLSFTVLPNQSNTVTRKIRVNSCANGSKMVGVNKVDVFGARCIKEK